MNLFPLVADVDWRLFPSNEQIAYFVSKNLSPLPVKPSKSIYASFFICPENGTLIVAKVKIDLEAGSFRRVRIILISLQTFKLSIVENRVRKIEEQKILRFGAFLTYTGKRKATLVFLGEDFKLEVVFSLSLLIAETEKLCFTAFSKNLNFKLNNRNLLPNKKSLSLIENFFNPINSFVTKFKVVEMSISFSESHKKGKAMLFFPGMGFL